MTAEAAEMDRPAATAPHVARVVDGPPAMDMHLTSLSPLHDMLGQIRRDHDSHWVNRLANHPDIYPLVRGMETGRLDLGPVVADPANVLLSGEFGALLFHQRQPGLYEVHSMALPEGRGRWMLGFVRACLHWMFTGTDAIEILTRCPEGNKGATALAKAIGGRFWFTNPNGWVHEGEPIPADIYRLDIQTWLEQAPGLVERGTWFHERLEAEFDRHGKTEPNHPDDAVHDRYVGAACEMMLAGQPHKGAIFYNRWAALADYEPVHVISVDPITVDIVSAVIIIRNGAFWAPVVR